MFKTTLAKFNRRPLTCFWQTSPASLNPELLKFFPAGFELEGSAEYLQLSVREYMLKALFQPLHVCVFDKPDDPNPTSVQMIPGGLLGRAPGPVRKCPVAFVGKMPGRHEAADGRCYTGPTGVLLKETLQQLGIDPAVCYGTNVLRFEPPDRSTKAKAAHIKLCMPLLVQELAMVYPQVIVLLGGDAVKAFFGKNYTLEEVRGGVFELHNPTQIGQGLPPWSGDLNVVKVIAAIHPAAVLRKEGYKEGFIADLTLLTQLLGTEYKPKAVGEGCDYRYVQSSNELAKVVDEVIAGPDNVLGIDCEWGGTNGNEFWRDGAVLRTIQFSWKEKTACVAVLRECGGKVCCNDETAMLAEIRRLIFHPKIKVVGHNLRADALWLEDRGIPIMEKQCGDTCLADHILHENSEHGLEVCVPKYTDMGRYDLPLVRWCRLNGYLKKKKEQFGYLHVPDDILLPYAACDADATLRLHKFYEAKLAEKGNEGPQRCYREVVIPSCRPIHEVEYTGLRADFERMIELSHIYDQRKDEVLRDIQSLLRRSDFNPRSGPQLRKLLFAPPPDGFGLEPIKTTEKPARKWNDAKWKTPKEEWHRLTPSTDAESFEMLVNEHPENKVLGKLQDYKILDQVCKTFLPTPEMEEDEDEDDIVYSKGLPGAVAPDQRVRCSINQMADTGRHKCSKPNLQQLPSKREKAMHKLVGENVRGIRSCFTSTPGWILISADYKAAEVFVLGYLSGCEKLIQDAKCDLHARGAVERFGAPKWDGYDDYKLPPEEWLQKNKALRISSKTSTFSIFYQRGAKALAGQIARDTEGALQPTTDWAQKCIDGFYGFYPEVRAYVDYCKGRVLDPGWIETPWGRRRHFVQEGEESFISEQQRQCINFVIQSTVADALNTSLTNLWWWRKINPERAEYKLLLPVHDAVLLECRPQCLETVIKEVVPQCMTLATVVPAWKPLANEPARKPFTLDVDVDFGFRWDEKAKKEELLAAGVPEHLIPEEKQK